METALIRIDPAHNAYRFYRLSLWPDLSNGIALLREWGQLGLPERRRLDLHPDEDAALLSAWSGPSSPWLPRGNVMRSGSSARGSNAKGVSSQ